MARSVLDAAIPSGPLLDETGALATAWRAFFMALYYRTGGPIGLTLATVQGNLDAEVSARIAADTAEANARARADADLLANINTKT